jgi:hypothetical protein
MAAFPNYGLQELAHRAMRKTLMATGKPSTNIRMNQIITVGVGRSLVGSMSSPTCGIFARRSARCQGHSFEVHPV